MVTEIEAWQNFWGVYVRAGRDRVLRERADTTKPPRPPNATRLPPPELTRAEALVRYERVREEYRQTLKPEYQHSSFLDSERPPADEMYRWQIQLSCGCVRELMTHGMRFPAESRWTSGSWPALAGEIECREHHHHPYRDYYQRVTEWKKRIDDETLDLPTGDGDREVTCARWTVTLKCGHESTVWTELLDWKPRDGHKKSFRRTSAEIARRKERMGQIRDQLDDITWAHHMRRIEAGSPEPAIESQCSSCNYLQTIDGVERIGWLVPPEKLRKPRAAPPAPRPTAAVLAARVAELEAEVEKLRSQRPAD